MSPSFSTCGIVQDLIQRSHGRLEIVLHYEESTGYEVFYCNLAASAVFTLPDLSSGRTLPWADLPQELAAWLSHALTLVDGVPEQALPEYRAGDQTYTTNLFYHEELQNEVREIWYLFCFSPASPHFFSPSEVAGNDQKINQNKLETVGELATGVAHDFNNLIMGIQSNAELFLTRSQTPEDQQVISNIIRACTLGRSLTRSLLGYAKKQPLSLSRFDLVEMVHDVVRIANINSHKYVSLHLGSDFREGNHIEVVGCYSSLSHCLLNLIKNAREASLPGGLIAVEWSEDAEKRAVLTVRDRGTGMSPQLLKQVFEPFFSTKKQGTGLGLAMVQGILAQHQGTVQIRSTVGVGTEVSLVWPRFNQAEKSISPSELRRTTQEIVADCTTSNIPRSGKLIFVVDDDPLVRNGLVILLRNLKYEVQGYANPETALQVLRSTSLPPDVVLTDYNMPGMNGEMFIREYHDLAVKNRLHSNVKILLMSGFPPAHFEGFLKEFNGLDIGVLEKPFSTPTLRMKIDDVRSVRKITARLIPTPPIKAITHSIPRIVRKGV
jgi:signal transduction histidine kinase/CheY-like chemotaxis protein